MKKKKWHKSRINDSWKMTRVSGEAIEVREPNLFEKILIKLRIK